MKLTDKNSILRGTLIGLVLPIATFALLYLIFEGLESSGWVSTKGFSPDFRQRTLAIVAIGLNVFPLKRFQKQRFTESMRGVVIATSVFIIAWVAYFGKSIF